jgi:hypothetical protein
MKSIFKLSLVAAFTLLLNACGGNNPTTTNSTPTTTATSTTAATQIDDSLWTDKDKTNAINACKFGYTDKNAPPVKLDEMCDCYLKKVIELSPNPVKQSDIPISKVIKLNSDCAKEAGLKS